MPLPNEIRYEFIESYLVDEHGRQIRVQPWAKANLFEPLDGYQSWRRGPRLCQLCKVKVALIHATLRACHVAPHEGCDGVDGEKVLIVVLNLKRQQGKTTHLAAYALSELFLARNSNTLFFAAAESQTERVFRSKFVIPIERNKKLASKVTITGHKIINERKGNVLEYVPTAKSVPGGSQRLLLVDEWRDVPDDVTAAAVPMVIGGKGLECPYGHLTCEMGPDAPKECPVCGTELEAWYGRIVGASSSGDATGAFAELVEHLEENPNKYSRLFRSTETLNPNANENAFAAIEETFGSLPSLSSGIRRELHNEFTRKGDEFLPTKAIASVVNNDLKDAESSEMRCIGFLDCSRTTELTSLILAGDPAKQGAAPAFEKLQVLRVDVWDPKRTKNKRVDYHAIRDHLELLFGVSPPRFPFLLELAIDVAGAGHLQDAQELFQWCRTRPWGVRVTPFTADRLSNQLMWQHLEQRVLGGTIAVPNNPRLVEELKSARLKITESGIAKVVDSAAGDRRGGKPHRDVSMALAGCCLLAAKYAARGAKGDSQIVRSIEQVLNRSDNFKPTMKGAREWRW